MFRKLAFASLIFFTSYSAFADKIFQEFNQNLHEKVDGKYAMKNQLLVALHPGTKMSSFINAVKETGLMVSTYKVISSDSAKVKIVKLKLKNEQGLMSLRRPIQSITNVEWVQPNYVYNIGEDPREEAPNDPKIKDQYHHYLMGNLKAWNISTGKDVVVAITDDGFDIKHEDLSSRINVEKGYNFCDDNNDVTPKRGAGEHGTHVAGITAAQLNNNTGGAGVAGEGTILPVRFYGAVCNWTSDLIYRSYQYAADNGAKIISTSYNVDGFVGDKTFIAGVDYAYNKGVLHFNSAGNNNQKDPPRGTFEELILVASTNQQDIKSYFSNYGSRVQISAPGEDILSTVPGNRYETMSGTSMATPNAAGSAALIWSLHPSWNRDQVAAQLIGTADNIDSKNPKYKGMLGSGRINNFRALTEQVAPVKITDVTLKSIANHVTLAVHFDKLLDPKVVNQGNHWEVKSLSDGSIIDATMDHPWFTGSTTLKLVLPELNPGKYQLTVKDSLQDPFGQALDGDANGNAGGNYVYVFEVT